MSSTTGVQPRQRHLRAALVCAAALATLGGLAAGPVAAQQFPTKILRVVNPNNPGGNSDVLFRLLAPKMGEVLGQQLVIDYRPGAGGNIGAESVSRAAPDGYTTLIAAASILINPAMLKKLPFDVEKDFTPLGVIVDIPAGMVVHPSLPVKTVQDLVRLAKSRPGQLNFSSSGNGALGHLSGALLNASTGIKTVHIPYKGAGPSIVDLVAGQVEFSFVSIPAITGHLQSGRLRMLAQCGEKRFVSFPDIPTMVEAGVKDFVVTSPFSYFGPAGMPAPVAKKLNDALRAALHDPKNNKILIDRGALPVGNTQAEHAALIKSEIAKWKRVAKAAGLEPL
jgi:tripartite-type tricarboxylate transporter receptor subunit TctC